MLQQNSIQVNHLFHTGSFRMDRGQKHSPLSILFDGWSRCTKCGLQTKIVDGKCARCGQKQKGDKK